MNIANAVYQYLIEAVESASPDSPLSEVDVQPHVYNRKLDNPATIRISIGDSEPAFNGREIIEYNARLRVECLARPEYKTPEAEFEARERANAMALAICFLIETSDDGGTLGGRVCMGTTVTKKLDEFGDLATVVYAVSSLLLTINPR